MQFTGGLSGSLHSKTKRIVAVINRQACLSAGTSGFCDDLPRLLERLGKSETHIVDSAELGRAVQKAAESRPDIIAVGGGDGSIGSAAGYIAGTPIALAVLPMGTFNHFAHDLGIPIHLKDALAVIERGETRKIDIGEVNGRVFVNNSSIGIYPEAVTIREKLQNKLGLGKYAAMGYALLKLLWDYRMLEFLIEYREVRRPVRTPFLFLGNNYYEPALMAAANRESLSEGSLSVKFAEETGRLQLIRIALSALLGRKKIPELKEINTHELAVKTRRRKLKVALDGEVHIMFPPLHFRSLHKSLRVVVPPGGQ